jgi:WD repeat and SOF domain-containing protein 1
METVTAVKYNQSETSVLASVGSDRTMCLYDTRTGKAERRIVMQVSDINISSAGRSYSRIHTLSTSYTG